MGDGSPKKLLMLAYHYPPAVSGGVERSARFARHLPSCGWTPIVLTTSRYGEGSGRGDERVVRTGELFVRLGGRGARAGRSGGAGKRSSAFSAGLAGRWIEQWLLVPDKHIRWGLASLNAALRLVREERIDAIYSSSPPESAHCLALALKRLTGKPWIMDLRDPWTIEPLRWYLRAGGARLALERRIERCAFSAADAIVANTEEAAEAYRERYRRAATRIFAIPNGWDEAEINAARAAVGGARASDRSPGEEVREAPFVVAHVGTFSRHADEPAFPKAFFAAVKELAAEGALSEKSFRVVLAGALHPDAEREIDRFDLGGIVERRGSISHADALGVMLRSDLLLLYDPAGEGRSYVRGKLYEYLAAGAWILGLVPEGASRRLLERSGHGVAVPPEDGDEIRRALLGILAGRPRPAPREGFDIRRFEGAELTVSLSRVLDGVTRRGEAE